MKITDRASVAAMSCTNMQSILIHWDVFHNFHIIRRACIIFRRFFFPFRSLPIFVIVWLGRHYVFLFCILSSLFASCRAACVRVCVCAKHHSSIDNNNDNERRRQHWMSKSSYRDNNNMSFWCGTKTKKSKWHCMPETCHRSDLPTVPLPRKLLTKPYRASGGANERAQQEKNRFAWKPYVERGCVSVCVVA